MPALVVAAVSALGAAVGGAFGATLVMYATQIATGVLLLGSMAMSNSAKKKAERRARDQYNAAQVDRLANYPATVAPRELVLGRVRKGGHVFFRDSVGQYREKFVVFVALAGHEIDGVEQVWLNDVAVTLDAGGWVQTAPYLLTRRESGQVMGTVAPPNAIPGTVQTTTTGDDSLSYEVTTYQYEVSAPKARITIYTGAPGQAADAGAMADFPGVWTSNHRADGIAYLKAEFFYDETAFPSGLPNVSATVRGARCFDPRTGLTTFTTNPALHMRHVLTHPYFGKRASLTADEDARLAAAANACDIAHNYGQGPVPMFRSSLVVPFGTAPRDALDDLAQAMAGQWADAGGEFFVRPGVYSAPVMALTEADLATVTRSEDGSIGQQPISISTHAARVDKVNAVLPRIWDAAQAYKQVTLAPVKGAALIAADGVERVREVEMQAVFYAQQAQHVAGILLRDARDPLTLTAAFKLRAYPLTMFDTITLTVPRYGWAAKEFMVLGRRWTMGGLVELTLKETAAAIFQPDAAFVASGYASNTLLTPPWAIQPPAALLPFSGTSELLRQADGTIISRVRLTWATIVDATLLDNGSVEVQWSALSADGLAWNGETTSARDTQVYLTGVPDGQFILLRARTRNNLAVSDWSEQVRHFVVGKTAKPADVQVVTVSGIQVAWTTIQEVDLAGYKLRFNYGNDRWWDYAAPLHDGLITESPYRLERIPAGECTILVKAVDTTGNESEAAAFAVYVFPEAPVSNVLLSYPQHPAFAGTLTNCTLVSGELRAVALDDFYSPADAPMYLPSEEAMYLPSQYAEMVYEFSLQPAEAGTLLLQTTIAGAYRIEYASEDSARMYEPPSDPMYLPLDDPFYGTPSAFQLWPGALAVDGEIAVRIRITVAGGADQGVISAVTAVLDVPDVNETVIAVAVAAGGTRVPIAETYNAIKAVGLTVYSGGTGVSARIVDKNPTLGPLVQIINSSGVGVAGTLDAVIQGY